MVPEGYVSMETALDYHGWLQKAPASVRSCIPVGRSRSYQNHFGEFIYKSLPVRGSDFFLGVRRAGSGSNTFLIAGRERALGDTLLTRQLRWKGVSGLCSSLRVDLDVLKDLDLVMLRELSEFYRSPKLRKYLRNLQQALGGE